MTANVVVRPQDVLFQDLLFKVTSLGWPLFLSMRKIDPVAEAGNAQHPAPAG
jgi:hypothetical protein